MSLEIIKNLNQFLLMLRSESFSEGVHLKFSNEIRTPKQMHQLQLSLLSPNFPSNLVLDLSDCCFTAATWQPFFLAMQCLSKVTIIHLNLSRCSLDKESLDALLDMMSLALPMKSFTLSLNNQVFETQHIEKLCNLLSKSVHDSALILNLIACGIDDQIFEALLNQLAMNHFLGALTVNVARNPLSGNVSYMLKKLIESGNAPKTFGMGFSNIPNVLTHLEPLIEAFISPQCPPNIHLDLSSTQMSAEKLTALSLIISQSTSIKNLSLVLNHNDFGITQAKIIRDAMNKRLFKFDHLKLNCAYNQLADTGAALLMKSISEGDAAHSFQLIISNNHLTSRCAQAVAYAITSPTCHNILAIDISNNLLLNHRGNSHLIFNALTSIHPEKKVSLSLRNCFVSDGIPHISRMPMDIYSVQIKSDVVLQQLAQALISGTCPKNLELDLSGNTIDIYGVKAFAHSMCSGNLPEGLIIHLRETDFGPDAARVVAKALQSPRMSCFFTLKLDIEQIGGAGVRAFSKALETLQCPLGTRIDIGSNRLANYCAENDRIYVSRRRLAFVQQSLTQFNNRSAVTYVPGLANAIFSYLYPAKLLAGNPMEIYLRLKETGKIQKPSHEMQLSYFEIEPSLKKSSCTVM